METTPHDLDRGWSKNEIAQLSERDLTTLQFRRDLRNAKFFVPEAVLFYFLIGRIGYLGVVLGWIGFAQFAIFAAYDVVAFLLRGAATIVESNAWKFAQLALLLVECGAYGIIAAAFWYRLAG